MALMTKTQERIDVDRFCPPTPNTSGVLVTGGAQRIGAAISDHLAALGWRVAIHHNKSEAPALALRDRIRQRGDRAEIIASICPKQVKQKNYCKELQTLSVQWAC